MQKIYFVLLFLFLGISATWSQNINNYDVKENLLKNSKLAIISCDTAGNPIDKINGNYLFVVNGFEQNLKFNEGIAIIPLKIDKSAFVFFKHHNTDGNHNQLYFVKKSEQGLKPIKVNVLWLLIVPIAIVMFISAIRKYLWIGVVLLVLYLYMGHNSGLSPATFIDSLFSQLQSLVG